MKHMKKTLLILAELEIIPFLLGFISKDITSYIKGSQTSQIFYAVAAGILCGLWICGVFRFNLKGISEKDLPEKKMALIIILIILVKLISPLSFTDFKEIMAERLGVQFGYFVAGFLCRLPWVVWITYSIVSTYDNNRNTEKEEQ